MAAPVIAVVAAMGRGFNSSAFWERRYASGGTSGSGSYGVLAAYKAKFLNAFVSNHRIASVVEFGCGDGNQLSLARYPAYIGYDVSHTILQRVRRRFARDSSKQFFHVGLYSEAASPAAELALSLDVIFHLVEDGVFDAYMRRLFSAASRFVVIYSSNEERATTRHVRHRRFASWIEEHATAWQQLAHERNPHGCALRSPSCGNTGTASFASFHAYSRRDAGGRAG